jgi:ATP-dependent DNA helicase Q4
MQDQIHNMCKNIQAAVCDSQLSEKDYQLLLQDLNGGKINVLFMSPEAIINRKIRNLPRLAFVCIDEIHCLSQWSHNFRPSYLQLGQMLLEHYNVRCILGLTATATITTLNEIKSYFTIDHNNILKDCDLPHNLQVTVSRDSNKDRALVKLFKSEEFKPFYSHIIVYCSRRDQTEKIAQLLRLSLSQNTRSNYDYDELATMEFKAKPKKWSKYGAKSAALTKDEKEEAIAEAYHAGLTSYARKRIQNEFIKGKLKIIVATMAFGMGINMPNIRAVIHYNMPKAIENYVQEIGRAGRDGLLSRCHVFLETQREEINEIKKYVHMNGYDQKTIKRLLLKVFSFCCGKEATNQERVHCDFLAASDKMKNELNHRVSLSIAELVEYLDVKEETIVTIFCYLESAGHIKILSNCYKTCTLKSYKGLNYLFALSKKNSFVAALINQKYNKNLKAAEQGLANDAELDIDIIQLCEDTKEEYGHVRDKLKRLEWIIDDITGSYKAKSGISLNFQNAAFCVRRTCICDEIELDVVNDILWKRVDSQMLLGYDNFKALYKVLSENSFRSISECMESSSKHTFENEENFTDIVDPESTSPSTSSSTSTEIDRITVNSNNLKKKLNQYFNNQLHISEFTKDYEFNYNGSSTPTSDEVSRLINDIKRFIYMYQSEFKLTGIVIARVFHGIPSPRFPAEVWGRNRNFWRAHFDFDFEVIKKYATEELIVA